MMDLGQRLNMIEETIDQVDFRLGRGLGNEVSYYIFDYPADQELVVRDHVQWLASNHKAEAKGYKLLVYDLYDIMIDYIEEKDYLEKSYQIEERRGPARLEASLSSLLRMDTDYDYFTDYIIKNSEENSVVFIVGTGKVYPFVRVHAILNKLHQAYDENPVVIFYPGEWDKQELVLFSEINDGNYYRAFRLV